LNRRTQVVSAGVFTSTFTYNAADQLISEDGSWASDTVTNRYTNRLRTLMGLQQPGAAATGWFMGWLKAG
jgi:YD repeat-containing protein